MAERLDTALAPQPQAPTPPGPAGLSPAPAPRAPASLEVPLSSCPLAGAAGPCAVPGPGGDPSHQSKDGFGIGNRDLPETSLLHPLTPGKARSSLGVRRPKDCQAARPQRGGSALPRLMEELPSDSHSAQPAGLRQATGRRNKPGDPCASPTPPCSAGHRRRTGVGGWFAERERGAAAVAGRGRGTGGAGQSVSWLHGLPQPCDGSGRSRAQAQDRAPAEIHCGAAGKSSSGGDGSRDGGSSAGPAGGGRDPPWMPHHPCGLDPTSLSGGPSDGGQKAARAASTWPTAQVQDRGGETSPRTAQGKGGEAGLEGIAPVK